MAMSEYWINSTGVKFVGEAGIVPAADNMSPNVVSYEDWQNLSVELTARVMPSELANADIQVIPLAATLVANGAEPEAWAYEMLFSVESDVVGVTLDSVVVTETGATVNLNFPAGVVDGDSAIVTCQTGGRSAKLVVVVESYA